MLCKLSDVSRIVIGDARVVENMRFLKGGVVGSDGSRQNPAFNLHL